MPNPAAAQPAAPRRLALFDLDGTITRHDSFGPFVLRLLAAQPARWWRTPLLLAPLLGYAFGRLDRGGLKGAILHRLFAGLSRQSVAAFARRYATEVVPARAFPAALTALRDHSAAGDYVVVLSASPDLYVPEIGRLLGAHQTICTEVRWNGEALDGRLAGPNRRDHEKARVLATLRAAHPGLPVIAYGNSEPDLVHMALCEEAVYVNASEHEAQRIAGTWPHIRPVRWH